MNWSPYVGLEFGDRACWELTRRVYQDLFGIELPAFAEYHALRLADRATIARVIQHERAQWATVTDARPGDVVLFRIAGEPSHIGIVIGEGRFLHTQITHAARIESYRTPRWQPRLEGFYRHADARAI